MSRITVLNHVSLDGVMQAPARPDEDTRGGFKHGGWAAADSDDAMMQKIGPHMGTISAGALLLGRRTYQDFAAVWPPLEDNPFTPVLNAATKYVVSTTLRESLGSGTRLFADDGRHAARRLMDSATTPQGVVISTYEVI